ncbi:hypothetical protein C8R44DRAFT_889476 [Mycena epipterygia]|nr:hypothetical protein C8R44DRAFT_889476 [Mycena epipterygia]
MWDAKNFVPAFWHRREITLWVAASFAAPATAPTRVVEEGPMVADALQYRYTDNADDHSKRQDEKGEQYQIRQWESEINRLIEESQAAGSFEKYTGSRGHSSGSTVKFSQWARRAETPVSSNAHHSASVLVKVKVYFQEDIFIVQLTQTTTYDDLVKNIGRKIRLCGAQRDEASLKFKYKDEGGDMVSMRNSEDVQMAFEERPGGQVTLYVT